MEPLGKSSQDIPQTEDEAREHIAHIRHAKGVDIDVERSADLAAALEIISNNIYHGAFRFLLELLQNADDNQFDVPNPTLWMELKKKTLRIETNERGFTRENVEAICSIGRSSKAQQIQGTRPIGEKGIGFMSVFRVANVVWIRSGHYSFKFDDSEELGKLAPIWSRFPEACASESTTAMLLELRLQDRELSTLIHEIKSFSAKNLVFLRQIKQVELKVKDKAAVWSKSLRCFSRSGVIPGFETVKLLPDNNTYNVFRHLALGLPESPKRQGLTSSEIVLAFPSNFETEPSVETQNVHAFLPVRDYGLKFILQADFILIANREDIDSSSIWNHALVAHASEAFLEAIRLFNVGKTKYSWLPFIPTAIKKRNLFYSFLETTLTLLSDAPILESMGKLLHRPPDLMRVPPNLAANNGNPMIPSWLSKYLYMSTVYDSRNIDALNALGVKVLTESEFLDDLSAFISQNKTYFQLMELVWHSRLAQILAQLLEKHRDQISKLPIVYLRDGRWISPSEGSLLLPLRSRLLVVPRGIPAFELDPKVVDDRFRGDFIRLLGAVESSPWMICDLIIETHRRRDFPPQNTEPKDLISHVVFLSHARWNKLSDVCNLWVIAGNGSFRRAAELYIESDQIYSASAVFRKDWPDIQFLNKSYHTVLGGTPGWEKWMEVNFGIPSLLKLVSISGPDPAHYTMSSDFKLFIEKYSSQTILGLLRHHWNYYARWLLAKDQDQPSEKDSKANLRSILGNMTVECHRQHTSQLQYTFLPRQSVLLGLGYSIAQDSSKSNARESSSDSISGAAPQDSVIDISNSFRNTPMLLKISDPENATWDFLGHFGVITVLKPVHFINRLRQLSGKAMSMALALSLYEQIVACSEESDYSLIREAFQTQRLIFVPDDGSKNPGEGCWVTTDECVWDGPPCLKRIYRLKPHYHGNVALFRRILGLRQAGLSKLLREVQQISPTDSVAYMQDIFIATSLLVDRATYTELTDQSAHAKLVSLKIWPVLNEEQHGTQFDCLADTSSVWYIPDNTYLRDIFRGKLKFLAFDKESFGYLLPLIKLLGLERRMISKAARSESRTKGEVKLLPNYTVSLRRKFRYIARLIPLTNQLRDKIISQIRSVEVFQSGSVSLQWTIVTSDAQVVFGRQEHGQVALTAEANHLQVFITSSDVEFRSPPLELVDGICNFCGITDPDHTKLVGYILFQHDDRRVIDELKRRGVQNDVPGFDIDSTIQDIGIVSPSLHEDFAKTVPQLPRELPSPLENSAAILPHLQRAGSRQAKQFTETRISSVIDSLISLLPDTSKNGDEEAPKFNQEIPSRPSTRQDARNDTMVPVEQSGKAIPNFEINAKYDDTRHMSTQLKFNPAYRQVRHGVMTLTSSRRLFENDVQKEEKQFAGELYVSGFLQEVMGDGYRPNLHWTSIFRSKAGHQPYSTDTGEASTFTIQDTENRLQKFFHLHNYKKARLISTQSIFHIQVAISSGSFDSSFKLESVHVKKAEKIALSQKPKHPQKDVFLLVLVYNIDSDPEVVMFADPWNLHTSGFLSLETYGGYSASLSDLSPALYTQSIGRARYSMHCDGWFRHQNLRSGEIRILRLAPGTYETPLEGAIRHVSLDWAGDFCALSYVWGLKSLPMSSSHLSTPTGNIALTTSLESALRTVRKEDETVSLWVDAISIDQGNHLEKVIQIRMMAEIFQSASSVFAWLGYEEEGSDQAIATLKSIRRQAQLSEGIYWPKALGGIANRSLSGIIPSLTDRVWASIDALFSRSWFRRAWIVQELVLPAQVHLVCGKACIDWDELFEALIICETQLLLKGRGDLKDILILPHAGPAFALGLTRQQLRGSGQKHSLLSLLEIFSHCRATVLPDKLFALLSVAADSNHSDFDPDYDSPMEAVVFRYAERFVRNGNVINLLCRAGTHKSYAYCSWIPDWTRGDFPQTISTWQTGRGMFYASRNIPPVASVEETPGSDLKVLRLRGFSVDVIISVTPLGTCTENFISFLDIVRDLRNLMSYIKQYPSGEPLDSVLLRMLVGDAPGPYLELAWDRLQAYRTSMSGTEEKWPIDLRDLVFSAINLGHSKITTLLPREQEVLFSYWQTSVNFLKRIPIATFCITGRGYVGLVPGEVQAGDRICLFHGSKVPCLLGERQSHFALLGEGYIHGFMSGEALSFAEVEERNFDLK